MAKRGRVISTSISLSTKIADLGDSDCCLLATWLNLHADDQGRIEADPRRLKGQVAPLLPWITVEVVERALQKMAQVRYIKLYRANGLDLLQLVDWWRECGKLDYTAASDYPPPPGWRDCPAGKGTAAQGGYGFVEFPGNSRNSDNVGDNPDKKLPPTPNPDRSPDPAPELGEGEREGEGTEPPADAGEVTEEAALQFYAENIEPLTPELREMVARLMADYSPPWLCDAVQATLKQGEKVRKYSYVAGILQRWKREGRDVRGDRKSKPIDFEQYTHGEYADLFGSGAAQ